MAVTVWMLFLSLGCEQGGDSFIFGTPCRGEQPGRVHGERGSEFEPLDFGGTFLSAPSPYATFKKGWLVGKHPRCSGCLGLGLGFAPGGSYCSLLCPLCFLEVRWRVHLGQRLSLGCYDPAYIRHPQRSSKASRTSDTPVQQAPRLPGHMLQVC